MLHKKSRYFTGSSTGVVRILSSTVRRGLNIRFLARRDAAVNQTVAFYSVTAVGRCDMNNIRVLVAAASVYTYAVFILPPIERTILLNISTPTAFASSEKRFRRKIKHCDPVVNTKVPYPPLPPPYHTAPATRPLRRLGHISRENIESG